MQKLVTKRTSISRTIKQERTNSFFFESFEKSTQNWEESAQQLSCIEKCVSHKLTKGWRVPSSRQFPFGWA